MKKIVILFLLMSGSQAWAESYRGDIIDIYSAIDYEVKEQETITALMQKAGVKKTLLGARLGVKELKLRKLVAEFAEKAPQQFIPLLKIMSPPYRKNKTFIMEKKLDRWMNITDWKGMGALRVYDEQGGRYAKDFDPLIVKLTDRRIDIFIALARDNRWPFIIEIPFGRMSKEIRKEYLRDLENLLSDNLEVNVVLSHLGQLEPAEVDALLERHKNLFLDISRSHPAYLIDESYAQIFTVGAGESGNQDKENKDEWAPEFVLHPEWKRLFHEYSDRFMVGYYNAGKLDWEEKLYMENTAWFRKALGELQPEAADLIAHGNAERLWQL